MTPSERTHDRREEQGECCPDGSSQDCCRTTGGTGQDGQRPKAHSWGRTAVFVVIMLAAVLLGARALMRGTSAEVADPQPEAIVTTGAGGGPGLTEATTDAPSPNASSASCCPAVSSAAEVTAYSAGKDAVFLILPGNRQGEVHAVAAQVEAVVNILIDQGRRVEGLTLAQGAPGYDALAREADVRSYPCVVVLGPSGQLSSVDGEITEDGLLRAFVEATMPPMSCGAPCGAPGTCGK